MTTVGMSVDGWRALPGRTAGLAEPTALATVRWSGTVADVDGADDRIRAGVQTLCPEEPLFGIAESDWPSAFLGAEPDPGAGPGPADKVGFWLGGWVVAITVALQRWSRDPVWRGRVLRAGPDGLELAIPWRREPVAKDALNLSLRLIGSWVRSEPDPAEIQKLHRYLQNGLESLRDNGLPPNTLRFVQAAVARGMPFEVLPSFVQLGWGAGAERIDSSFTGGTGVIGTAMARNKFKTSRTLAEAGLPLPAGEVVGNAERALHVAVRLGWPVVVKPLHQDQGAGVVPGIRDANALLQAFGEAGKLSPGAVIVEKHVAGADHRLLVVGGRVLAAAQLSPAGVTGDGVHTVAELLAAVNSDPRRGGSARSLLKTLVLDDKALGCLAEQGLAADAVPAAGRRVELRRTANISTGGSAEDVTGAVHPDNRELAERAARIVGLDIAGIDFLCPDIGRSWRDVGGAICEVNAQPGFRPHWLAQPDRDLNGEILDILFTGRVPRIPTAAVVGDAEAGATAQALQRFWTDAGLVAGVCTRNLLRIGTGTVSTADLTGVRGPRIILTDPAVAAAVFEVPIGRLAAEGHPCDRYDVVAVLDHAHDRAEDRAHLAELLRRVRLAVLLNADDRRCLAVQTAGVRRILVSRQRTNRAVAEHCAAGGDAVLGEATGTVVAVKAGVETSLGTWSGDLGTLYATASRWALGERAAAGTGPRWART